MTVSASGRVFKTSGDGVTTSFPFARNYFQNADIKVFLVDNTTLAATLLTYSTDYVINGNPDTTGGTGFTSGTVLMNVAPAAGKTLVIHGDTSEVQNLDLSNVTSWNTAAIEDALDLLTILVQEHQDRIDRAVRGPRSRIGTFDYTLPIPVASMLLGIKNDGSGLALFSGISGIPANTQLALYIQTAISGNAPYLVTTSGMPALSAFPSLIIVTPGVDNLGSGDQIKFDGYATLSLKKWGGGALSNGDFANGIPYLLAVTSTDARIFLSGAVT